MFPIELSNLQLRSNSISPTDDDRILESSRFQIEQSTESTDDRVGTDSLRRFDDGIDLVDELVSGVDGYSC